MAFQPWLGNFNPTDQQKNEYIRLLKVALVNLGSVVEFTSGTFTGDGTASQVISLDITTLTPSFVLIVKTSGTGHVGLAQETLAGASNSAFIVQDGTLNATITTGRIGSFTVGSFVALGTSGTGMNISSATYSYFVLGSSS